jgi:hypothetical protein
VKSPFRKARSVSYQEVNHRLNQRLQVTRRLVTRPCETLVRVDIATTFIIFLITDF